MRVPQVSERIKEAPAQALRGVFAGIGQLLLITDKLRNKGSHQDVPRARTPGASASVTDTAVTSPAGQGAGTAAAPAGTVAEAAPARWRCPGWRCPGWRCPGRGGRSARGGRSGRARPGRAVRGQAGHRPARRRAGRGQARHSEAGGQAGHGQAAHRPAPRGQGGRGVRGGRRRGAAEAAQAAEHQGLRQDRQRAAARRRDGRPGRRRGAPAAAGPEPAAAADPAPLPNYDELSVPSLRARLRNLDVTQVRQLAEYERAHAARAEVLTMFERRIAKLEAEA